MKRIALFVFAFILFVVPVSRALAVENSPEDIVRQFYTWYIGRLVKDDFKPLKNRTVSLKYLTPQFIAKVPGLIKKTDADPIICAQDFDASWVKNMKIDPATIQGAKATTNVQLDTTDANSPKLKITLKQTTAGWRIDSVDCGY
ncbi:MAG TPA: DUF3828 domain-containing protein [Pyrinomonadaceae bacterium]